MQARWILPSLQKPTSLRGGAVSLGSTEGKGCAQQSAISNRRGCWQLRTLLLTDIDMDMGGMEEEVSYKESIGNNTINSALRQGQELESSQGTPWAGSTSLRVNTRF